MTTVKEETEEEPMNNDPTNDDSEVVDMTSKDQDQEQEQEEKEKSVKDEESVDMDGTRWKCPTCHLYNNVSQWQCIACYTPMRNLYRAKMFKMRRHAQYEARKAAREAKRGNSNTSNTNHAQADEDSDVDVVITEEIKDTDGNTAATTTTNGKDSTSQNKVTSPENIMLAIPGLVIPKVMRALVKKEAGKGFELVDDFPVPEPGAGELLVRAFATSICGSDLMLYKWTKDAELVAKTPFIPGHECAGLIVKRGAYTKRNRKSRLRFQIGARVAVENHLHCSECYQCVHGRPDICANLNQFGHGKGTIYGGCAEYFLVHEKYCYEIQSNLSWRDVALLEPLGVAVNACNNAEISRSRHETVLVIGCGPIGCMVCAVARAQGAKRVIACDIVPWKLEKAKVMGATDVFNSRECNLRDRILELTEDVGVGRLIECSGNAAMLNQSFACVRKGGNMVLVGLPKHPLHVENVLTDVIFRSLQIRTIHGRRSGDWKIAESLVANGKIDLDPLVLEGHGAFPLAAFEEAYKALFDGKAMKVVFDPTKV